MVISSVSKSICYENSCVSNKNNKFSNFLPTENQQPLTLSQNKILDDGSCKPISSIQSQYLKSHYNFINLSCDEGKTVIKQLQQWGCLPQEASQTILNCEKTAFNNMLLEIDEEYPQHNLEMQNSDSFLLQFQDEVEFEEKEYVYMAKTLDQGYLKSISQNFLSYGKLIQDKRYILNTLQGLITEE